MGQLRQGWRGHREASTAHPPTPGRGPVAKALRSSVALSFTHSPCSFLPGSQHQHSRAQDTSTVESHQRPLLRRAVLGWPVHHPREKLELEPRLGAPRGTSRPQTGPGTILPKAQGTDPKWWEASSAPICGQCSRLIPCGSWSGSLCTTSSAQGCPREIPGRVPSRAANVTSLDSSRTFSIWTQLTAWLPSWPSPLPATQLRRGSFLALPLTPHL